MKVLIQLHLDIFKLFISKNDITTIESEIGRTFWFFRAMWNGVNYFSFSFFCLLSGAHRPHCPKATKLTYVWCNLKKKLYNSKWCMITKIQSLSQPVNFSNKKQRNGDFIFWNYQIINKNYKPSISTLHLCEKKQKNMLALLHIK